MRTLSPVSRSNFRIRSSTTARTPFVQNTVMSAARADDADAMTNAIATNRVSVFISNLVSVLPDKRQNRSIESLGLFPVGGVAGLGNHDGLRVLHVHRKHLQHRWRREHVCIAG